MGTHFELSGQACREIEGFGLRDWAGFFVYLRSLGGKFSRLDVAFDDRAGVLDIDLMYEKFKCRERVSRWQDGKRTDEVNAHGPSGHGFMLGVRGSDFVLRVYNKALQAVKAGKAVAETVGHWVRVEPEIRHDRAEAAVTRFIETGSFSFLAEVIKYYIDFKEPNPDDRTRSRWVTSPFWVQFLGEVEKCGLAIEPVRRTIERKIAWIKSAVSRSLALAMEHWGGDFGELVQVVNDGRRRLRPCDYALLGGT